MPKYNSMILNYYNDDSHVGTFSENSKNIGTGLIGSPSCGDVMKLQIKVDKKTQKIVDAKILVFGCGSAKASSSYVAEKLIGLSIEDALKIKNTDIAQALELPRIKLHCSVLAEGAIKKAVDDYKQKNNLVSNKSNSKHDNKNKTNKHIDNFSLEFSPKALEFTKQNLYDLGKKVKGIRLEIAEGHCGLMYKVKYVEKTENTKDDIDYKVGSLHVFIRKAEKDILNGTKIDFKEEGLKRGLVFSNPRETGRCNCGQNFFTKNSGKNKSTC